MTGAVTPEQRVLERLAWAEASGCGVAGFSHPEDRAAAIELERRGLALCAPGEGRDLGLLLVRRKAFAAPLVVTSTTGGDAA